ncbi:MAG: cytochrome c oxidase subunit II [Chloroflexi bacterium]|nr:cytochrome c oxidase subunit II [Chloroflexota bacterium]MBI3339174.1 cytochrome c oxidase subunit II [Chloroflexota bacterium]
MKRHLLYAGLLWIILTAIGEYAAFNAKFFTAGAAAEAVIVDDAFRLLMLLGTPVFTFVLAGLVYSVLAFRARSESIEDGPPIRSSRTVTWLWLVITSGLAIFIFFNPGVKGLNELNANPNADLVVQVQARKWAWKLTYPEYNVTIEDASELVLPVNRRVKFEITSADVIHAFWVPAFRMKIDAMPGQTNVLYITPNQLSASSQNDFNLRVQCAELCGTGHARMRAQVRVVEQSEFEAWLAGQ